MPPPGQASDPASVLRTAKTARDGYGATQPDDRVWCVIDVDHHAEAAHIKDFTNALKEARDASIETAVSNPCFEVWYLLHYADVGSTPLRHYEDVRAALAAHEPNPRLEGGVPPACVVGPHITAAIARAGANHRDDAPWPPSPGTGVHRLVASLLAPPPV